MPDNKADRPLPDLYRDMISSHINAHGVHPYVAIAARRDNQLEIASIDGDPKLVASWLRQVVATDPAELIFSTDRYTMAGQGTELGDVLVGAFLQLGVWRPFIIEYQHDPRIVRPIVWDNAHWNGVIAREIAWMIPGALVAEPT